MRTGHAKIYRSPASAVPHRTCNYFPPYCRSVTPLGTTTENLFSSLYFLESAPAQRKALTAAENALRSRRLSVSNGVSMVNPPVVWRLASFGTTGHLRRGSKGQRHFIYSSGADIGHNLKLLTFTAPSWLLFATFRRPWTNRRNSGWHLFVRYFPALCRISWSAK